MALLVLGLGTSHGPQLSTPPELWRLHAERDFQNDELTFRGQTYTYRELGQLRASEGLEKELGPDLWQKRYDACQRGVAAVAEALARAAPDILVVVGDDQRELFLEDNTPTLAVFWGDRARCVPRPAERVPPWIEPAAWAWWGSAPEEYRCHPELGKHLVESMMAQGFDVAQFTRQPEGRSLGHAFSFVERRILQNPGIPIVPVMINTYYPPNQPTPGRCYAFGQALRRAIESWEGEQRVAILASGGLSHFVIDEELDRRVLAALARRDAETLSDIPVAYLNSGTSETRNWIAVGGAAEHLTMELLDYVPAYRTGAGTGCGMAFACWQ